MGTPQNCSVATESSFLLIILLACNVGPSERRYRETSEESWSTALEDGPDPLPQAQGCSLSLLHCSWDFASWHLSVPPAAGTRGAFGRAPGQRGLFVWDPGCGAEVHSFILSCFFGWSLHPVSLQCFNVRGMFSQCSMGKVCNSAEIAIFQFYNVCNGMRIRNWELQDSDVKFLSCLNLFCFWSFSHWCPLIPRNCLAGSQQTLWLCQVCPLPRFTCFSSLST